MKKNIFAILLLLFTATSCSDFLDKEPDDMLTQEMVFNQKTRTEEWLAGLYSQVMDSYMDNFERQSFLLLADEATVPLELAQFRVWSISAMTGNWNTQTDTRVDIWGETYKSVRRAYIFINEAKALPQQSLTQKDVDNMKLEARFLIAYYYQQMLEVFGPFPLVKGLVKSEATNEELMLQRTPYDEILGWLDSEFTELAAQLPEVQPEGMTTFGRPNKGVALACKARLWLFAASPIFNGNEDFKNEKNPDGTFIFTQQPDPTRWRKAADACKELIDLSNTGVYDLYKEYYNGSQAIDPFLSLQNMFLRNADVNKEIIFARPGSWDLDYSYYDKLSYPRGMGGFGPFAATQALVDAFFTKDGKPIKDEVFSDKDPNYSEVGLMQSAISYPNTNWDQSNAARTKGLVTDKSTFKMYINREPRFYVSVRFNEQYIPAGGRKSDFFLNGMDGRPSFDTPPTGYMVRKRVDPDYNLSNGHSQYRPAILMRLGEFYLNYAEALNECDPGNSDILKYLNLIRQRAGIPDYSSDLLNDQGKMRAAIRAERRVELSLEGLRYHDMRRWKIAEQEFQNPIMGMDLYSTVNQKSNFYKRTKYIDVVFTKKNYLWPIPQKYMDKNPNLKQNPYW